MKILSLNIDGYKMFNPSSKMKLGGDQHLLIGINGSGKSTILEAIAIIFSSVKSFCEDGKTRERKFNFSVEYSFNTRETIEKTSTSQDAVLTINHIQLSSSKESGLDYTMAVNGELITNRQEMYNYLPDNLVFYYAGFSDILENIIKEESDKQAEKLLKLKNQEKIQDALSNISKNLVYIEKKHYPILFLLNFIDREMRIPISGKRFNITSIQFHFQKPQGFSSNDYRNFYNFSGFLSPYLKNLLTFTYEQEVILDEDKNPYFDLDFHLGLLEAFRMIPELTDEQKFENERFWTFHFLNLLLYIGIVKDVSVQIRDENEHTYNITELSEGEQQLITLEAIKTTLAQENTVLLLDEPDAFLHPQRQRELFGHINQIYSNHFVQIIATTHSPFIAQSFELKNILMFSTNGKTKKTRDRFLSYVTINENLFGVKSEYSSEIEDDLKRFQRTIEKMILSRQKPDDKFIAFKEELASYGESVEMVVNYEFKRLLREIKDV